MPDSVSLSSVESEKEQAFQIVFCRSSTITDVRRWLARLSVPASDLWDLAQDVFARGLKTWCSYDPRRMEPLRWLYQITRSVASAYNRRVRRRGRWAAADDEGEVDAEDPSPSPHACLEVLEGLSGLDAVTQKVIIAFDVDGIPMKIIAGDLGISLPAAYARRSRGIASLQMDAALIRAQASRAEDGLAAA